MSRIGIALMLLHFLPGILSWGDDGHYAICKIAEGLLSDEAKSAVNALLPDYANGDLASLCSWPDNVQYQTNWRWTIPLHFSYTPNFTCTYESSRDCHDFLGNTGICVNAAIYNYSTQLETYISPNIKESYNLTEALLFLSHYIGDIHQPLHLGFAEDLGAVTIILYWYTVKVDLHHVWDEMIIESALTDYYNLSITNMVKDIQANITDDLSTTWGDCANNLTVCPNVYASESVDVTCEYALSDAAPYDTLDDTYFLSRLPVVMKRLAQGGVRLAATLNRIFATNSSSIALA